MFITINMPFKNEKGVVYASFTAEVETTCCPRIGEQVSIGAPYFPEKAPGYLREAEPIQGEVVKIIHPLIGRRNGTKPVVVVFLEPPKGLQNLPTDQLKKLAGEHDLIFDQLSRGDL